MHATEYTLPRRPAAPQARGLGTPVTSLPGATRVDEVPTPAPPADADAPPARASDKSPPPPPPRARPKAARRRGGLLDGVAATAAFATRHAVVRPLLAVAPLAYHLLPEHVAAELVADVVACVAALASVFLESAEGAAFEAACRDAFEDAFRAASSPEGRKLAVGGTTLAIRAFEAFASEESRALMDAGEAVALDALDLLATPEARDAVRGARGSARGSVGLHDIWRGDVRQATRATDGVSSRAGPSIDFPCRKRVASYFDRCPSFQRPSFQKPASRRWAPRAPSPRRF